MQSTLETWSDEQLVVEAKEGSSACFELLVRRYQVRLMRFLLRSLKQDDAEDVVQDAFVQAYMNLSRFDPKYRFKTWLFVIAQRLMIDRFRKHRPTVDVDGCVIADRNDPHEHVEQRERSDTLWAVAKRELNEEVFRAVWLHYVEQMETAQIAKVLDRSWVWVKTALHRARRKLAPHVKSLVEVEPSPKAGESWQTI